MLGRRRFLFLLGGAVTGVWLASTGLVHLERRFVLALGGSCSFCGKDRAETAMLVGTVGQSPKICDECVGLSCDVIAEEIDYEMRASRSPPVADQIVLDVSDHAVAARSDSHDQLAELLRRLAEERDSGRTEALLANAQRALDAGRPRLREFRCSFCDAERRDVAKLITGMDAFICDVCIGDAAAVVGNVLRA